MVVECQSCVVPCVSASTAGKAKFLKKFLLSTYTTFLLCQIVLVSIVSVSVFALSAAKFALASSQFFVANYTFHAIDYEMIHNAMKVVITSDIIAGSGL
jgi:hypothetical protein